MPAQAAQLDMGTYGPDELQEDLGVQLARQVGMVLCQECANLYSGYCIAAAKGMIQGAAKRYAPVLDTFRRCRTYIPIGIKE